MVDYVIRFTDPYLGLRFMTDIQLEGYNYNGCGSPFEQERNRLMIYNSENSTFAFHSHDGDEDRAHMVLTRKNYNKILTEIISNKP